MLTLKLNSKYDYESHNHLKNKVLYPIGWDTSLRILITDDEFSQEWKYEERLYMFDYYKYGKLLKNHPNGLRTSYAVLIELYQLPNTYRDNSKKLSRIQAHNFLKKDRKYLHKINSK